MRNGVISTKLKIQPKGRTKGGSIALVVQPESGIIHFVGNIVLRRFLFNRRITFQGSDQVDPACLLSENCAPGRVIRVGPMRLVMDDVMDGLVLATVVHKDQPGLRGQAMLNARGKYITLKSIALHGRACRTAIYVFAS